MCGQLSVWLMIVVCQDMLGDIVLWATMLANIPALPQYIGMDYICYVCRFFARNANNPAHKVKAGEIKSDPPQTLFVYVCDKCYKGIPQKKKHANS